MNISDEQINKIFELASMEDKISVPKEKVTSDEISEALIEIERKLNSFSAEVKVDTSENKPY